MSLSDSDRALADLFDTPLLSSLSKVERVNFEKNCTIRKFALGHNIVEQGDNQNNVFFMLFGTAQVLNYSEAGRAITYAVLEKGDMFGEMAAIDGLPRSAWVCTVTPCTVASLSGSDFIELVTSNPKMALAVLRKLSANLRALDERLADIERTGPNHLVQTEPQFTKGDHVILTASQFV